MEYAEIINSHVARVILADTEFIAALPGEWVDCTGKECGVGWAFDGVDFLAPQVIAEPVPRHITPLAFRRRFTPQERAAIEWAAVDRTDLSNEQRMQAAALRSDLKDQSQATFIDLDDEDVVFGVERLELGTLIAEGRAAVILGATIQDGEKP